MTESLRLFATFNQSTNQKLAALLADLAPSAYTQERKTYFKSIQGLQVHLLQTTRFLQGLVRAYSGGKYLAGPLTDEAFEPQASTLDEVTALQARYDADFTAFTQVFDPQDLSLPKTRRTMRSGRTFLLSLSDVLTQYMVHTVHHRGQLSQILDEMGVDHDFGGAWLFAEEVG